MSQLTARDYKKPSGGSLEPGRLRDFGAGLLAGAVATAVLFGVARHHEHTQAHVAHAAGAHASVANAADTANAARPRGSADPAQDGGHAAPDGAAAPSGSKPVRHYDFYQMLPHFEVIVPQKEHPVKPAFPTAPIQGSGTYVLQAGSYRQEPQADRVAKRLGARGIPAKVERVSIDADVWYRVRVGPISSLSRLNRLRTQLAAANVDSLVIRVSN
ncbi:MAG: SPOR domain-containing protein [Steroidobacteraceae bacterium]